MVKGKATLPLMPLKIAIVSPSINCGGSENCVLSLGNYLQKQGHSVELLTTVELGIWFNRLADVGIKGIHIEGAQESHPLIHAFRVGKRIAKGNYDIIFLNNAERYAQSSIAMLPDRVVVIPMIRSNNEYAYEVGSLNSSAWNALIGVGPKIVEVMKSRLPNRPVLLVMDGIDIPSEARIRKRQIHSKPLQLVFVGRLEHSPKGVLFLPAVIKECRDRGMETELTIIGDGIDRNRLKEEIARLGVDQFVRFLGILPHHKVLDSMLDSHVLLLPSLFEGLPGAPLEAQAYCCVPIASNLPGITDAVIEDGKTGFLVPCGDAASFANRVAQLYENPQLWTAMSKAGYEKVSREFSLEVMGQNYIRLISDALAGKYPLPRSRKWLPPISLSAFRWWELVPKCLLTPYRRVKSIFLPSYDWRAGRYSPRGEKTSHI